ncbi:hypothetical protein ANRL4_03845 [Anaerolineae bacterium]|nr:hypothetical protein ANRL4_03845 [Anaerolineae bacterium]
MSATLNLLTPWITLIAVSYLLVSVRTWILRHIFGVSWLASSERNLAVIVYLLVLLPGVLLREISRYLTAGIVRIAPAFVTLTPNVGDDGIIDIRFVHFIVLNPVYAALIALAPFVSGLVCITVIAQGALDIPSLLAAIRAPEGGAVGAAIKAMVERENFLIWVYILFGVANACLPTFSELRATWFMWVIAVMFIVLLAMVGLYQGIQNLFAGPVAQVLYGLSTIFVIILGLNLIVAVGVWVAEKVLELVTDKKVQYQPAQAAAKPARIANAPRTVNDLRLPVPGLPGKAMPLTVSLPTLPEPEEKPALPARPAAAASLPARATGTGLPAVPEKVPALPPKPAAVVPPPPPKMPAATVTGSDAGEKPVPAAASPLKPPTIGAPRTTGEVPKAEPGKPPFAPAARQTGEFPKPPSETPKPAPVGAPRTTGEAPKAEPGKPPFAPAARQTGEFPKQPAELPKPAPLGAPRTTGEAPKPAFGSPFPPAKKDEGADKPAAVSGPPALARPSAPTPAKPPPPPVVGKPFGDRAVRPAPKPAGKSAAEARSPSSRYDDDDYIDADVIDDEDYIDADIIDADDVDEPPTPKPFGTSPFGKAGNKDKDNDLKYVDPDKE